MTKQVVFFDNVLVIMMVFSFYQILRILIVSFVLEVYFLNFCEKGPFGL